MYRSIHTSRATACEDVLLSSAVDTLIVDHNSMAAAGPLLESLSRPLTVLLPDAAKPDWPLRATRHRYITRADIEDVAPAAPSNAPRAARHLEVRLRKRQTAKAEIA
jgi:hypothetical protein